MMASGEGYTAIVEALIAADGSPEHLNMQVRICITHVRVGGGGQGGVCNRSERYYGSVQVRESENMYFTKMNIVTLN